jgi:plastocyanin
MLIRMLALSLLAPLVLLAACGDDDNATSTPKPAAATTAAGAATTAAAGTTAKDVAITAADFSLTPATITAAAGQKINVTLTNSGSVEHSFTVGSTDVTEADGGATGTGEYTVKAGDTEFHCKYHPTTMKGTITISGSSSQNLAPSATAASGISGGYGY